MSNRLLEHPAALCNMVRRIAREAGEITLRHFDDAGYEGADTKGDGSPVTVADQEAEDFIKAALADITPDVPMVGEESVSGGDIPDLSKTEYYWMVDPLDGTKEFISGSGDYTVNIALLHHHKPVLGVVFAPVPGELYAGHGLGTAVRWLEDSDSEKPVQVRQPPRGGLTVVASRSHGDNDKMDNFLEGYKIRKLIKRGSSLKICAVAAGKADIYPRFSPTCEWDVAAGHAVLSSAGGFFTDSEGNDFVYGKADQKFLNPEFIASAFAWQETILEQAVRPA